MGAVLFSFLSDVLAGSLEQVQANALANRSDDPLEAFQQYFGGQPEDEILRYDTDLNGDGTNEVLLAYSKSDRYTDGHLWRVFYKEGAKWRFAFQSAPEARKEVASIFIHPKFCFVGKTITAGKHALLTFAPKKNSIGQLTAWNLERGELKSRTFDGYPSGQQREEFGQIFGKQSMFPKNVSSSRPLKK
ncbi:MAG TPA: hypothetical protein VGF13_22255 [Verrucomicrobiae bacterium]